MSTYVFVVIYYLYMYMYIIYILYTYTFCLSVNSLTLSHNCQEKFLSQWGLLNNWWNGARRLSTVEKEEASTFQAADLATTVQLRWAIS